MRERERERGGGREGEREREREREGEREGEGGRERERERVEGGRERERGGGGEVGLPAVARLKARGLKFLQQALCIQRNCSEVLPYRDRNFNITQPHTLTPG